ncbi:MULTISPECIES: pyruvate, phosphate dikinase [unclassified Candidatus Frackibacter]|uniref:pyruvate, phosphate dikinase n=1 Tax=unclassified Candidatus Frackibacter TaxID=2648818 RepID=UPI0008898C48|nr:MULTISPECIES: pyruvate, phosphate dikinase [unclassified Candidatus Frackibacter]SDC63581.1 pyruvate phosphate dikinase [Candidatus Frackibacter sp. WG11]SEM78195.1 pyruvate phosphate dikinase [Candidatus Frackibacter sp. WG12]SFL87923.1 pyruvate phosphate dikinase [Candidatus Frackibacter sp. WG13]
MTSEKKYIYSFEEGSLDLKPILGGKGASLGEMTGLDLPVPPGMTLTTEACNLYYENDETLPEFLAEGIKEYLKEVEEKTGKNFGDNDSPLLLSVRSGAIISMPGMMDTILNLGLNDQSVKGLAKETNDERFAYDCYRRFIQMFGDVVLKIEGYKFGRTLDALKEEVGAEDDLDLTTEDLQELVVRYKAIIKDEAGIEFPQDPMDQLITAVEAVFGSWNNERAIIYRNAHDIAHDLGTAVNIQTMVFGNMGDDSGTGVVFTRNPSTGENELYGEYLLNAQGEDVVAGIRTPKSIQALEDSKPNVFKQLVEVTETLEDHYQDMQDIEFTIEKGKLYLLQTRTGKRTAKAAIKIASDMADEGLITKEEALLRVEPKHVEKVLHRQIDPDAEPEVIAKGLPASPGAAAGQVVFCADEAEKLAGEGKKVILVSLETTPEDIHGVLASQGVLTTRGGMTSHAAVVARGMGKPCVCGCEEISVDFEAEEFLVSDQKIRKGDHITINGGNGEVIVGSVDMTEPKLSKECQQILNWADELRELEVRTNADNGPDAAKADEFAAQGIGLCRTEHMFMAADRVPIVQKLILSESKEEETEALAQLEPMQKDDFEEIFKAMKGKPVTVRLLDPPLHEFLPDLPELIKEVTELENAGDEEELKEKRELLRKVKDMSESNPMLGFRGCRLGIMIPEIYEMQVRAVFKAAIELVEEGVEVNPEIMLPLVTHVNEFKILREKVENIADQLLAEANLDLEYKVGTMIELPRACMTADQIAKEADFFSFGTNDLTQTTFGFSRDDAESKFLHYYVDEEVIEDNPFISLDANGVGKLVNLAADSGRKVNPNLKVGICGEHGGEPKSIALCHEYGLDYVSCSPYRVPVARLAAAQAKINSEE